MRNVRKPRRVNPEIYFKSRNIFSNPEIYFQIQKYIFKSRNIFSNPDIYFKSRYISPPDPTKPFNWTMCLDQYCQVLVAYYTMNAKFCFHCGR